MRSSREGREWFTFACSPGCTVPFCGRDPSSGSAPFTNFIGFITKQKRKLSSLRCSFLIVRLGTGNPVRKAGQRLSKSAAKIGTATHAHAAHAHGHHHGHHDRLLLHSALLLSSMIHLKWCCKEDNTYSGTLSTPFDRVHCFPFVFAGDDFVNSCRRLAFPAGRGYNEYVCRHYRIHEVHP